MDERDAKSQGIEIHRREMAFVKGFVTCTNCGACYDQNNEPRFCQNYSRRVDPAAAEENIFIAEACDQWVANGLDRNKVVHPDHSYRYDKLED